MSRRRPLKAFVIAMLTAGLLALSGTALAHGDIKEASPAAGARVPRVPAEVSLTLAEPAARGSSLDVTDGCGKKAGGSPVIEGDVFSTAIKGGEPGKWTVDLRSISAVDGHLVKERYSFRVAGKKDCSPKNSATPGEDTDISPDTSSRAPIENPDEGTSFPVVPFALGTVAVVAVALAVRQPWNRS